MTRSVDFQRYVEACNYPGTINEAAVERALHDYLSALGVKRKVVRIKQGWTLEDLPSFERTVNIILDDFAKRTGRKKTSAALAASDASAALAASDALDASDARAARDARAALDASDASDASDAEASFNRFAKWCAFRGGWWWSWDLSWLSTTEIGAQQNNAASVSRWSKPVLEAYVAGCWFLYWTDDTLYWIAKPVVKVERLNDRRRLHCEDGPAVANDLENLYFWHGVLVPAFVVTYPEWITVQHIETEANAEVRRIMIERYGLSRSTVPADEREHGVKRYIRDCGATVVDHDEIRGTLYRKDEAGDDPIYMVRVVNRTPEADGSFKEYFLDVSAAGAQSPGLIDDRPGFKGKMTAQAAVAATFGLRASQYAPLAES